MKTTNKHGLWISAGEDRAERIKVAIDLKGYFTQVVDFSSIHPRPAELAIVSLSEDSVDYLAIATKGRMVATDQVTISLSHFVSLGDLSLEQLAAELPNRFASKVPTSATGIWRPSPVLWEQLVAALGRLAPDTRKDVPRLRQLITTSSRPSRRTEGGLNVFERDAVATALQTWGGVGYRKRILRQVQPVTNEVAPFLSRLGSSRMREDPQINHDHAAFPGMEVARRYQVGAIELANEGERLTILNCNRQPLEQTLGVDLIYYNHRFDSFVLVQYKRMTEQRDGTVAYRPMGDSSHHHELDRMNATSRVIAALPNARRRKLDACRLSTRPFFFKLCEAKAKSALDVGMVNGMYIPLDVWRRLLKNPVVRGKRGGVAVGWHNCPRKFSNSEFTSLLRNGWIGSSAKATEMLASVIEEVLGTGHMLILAVTSAGTGSRDYRRNTVGQFTADDDPLGVF
jgi:hypothetical protein